MARDITPEQRLYPGAHLDVRVGLTDDAGDPITGAADALTVTIVRGSTTTTAVGTSGGIVEIGGGFYRYRYLITGSGMHAGDWYYDGLADGVDAFRFLVNPKR